MAQLRRKKAPPHRAIPSEGQGKEHSEADDLQSSSNKAEEAEASSGEADELQSSSDDALIDALAKLSMSPMPGVGKRQPRSSALVLDYLDEVVKRRRAELEGKPKDSRPFHIGRLSLRPSQLMVTR